MRYLVVWCPDWPVVAALAQDGLAADMPAAVCENNRVLAASASARSMGVRGGMRKREAQSRCPDMAVFAREPLSEARAFERVLSVIEDLNVLVSPMRPGLCVTRVSGRFRGSEENVAALLAEHIVAAGVWDCRIGIADDVFTAEQAARQASVQECRVVPAGESEKFLANLPVDVFPDRDFVSLLHRLGIVTLADFASLDFSAVHTRFGSHGAAFHRLARARSQSQVGARAPVSQMSQTAVFEPAVDSIETLAFSIRSAAEAFITQLGNHVCTELSVSLSQNNVAISERTWMHSQWFTATDVVDRVRWQAADAVITAGIDSVTMTAQTLEPIGVHGAGLFDGPAPEERVVRAIARVQSMLGHEAVTKPVLAQSRTPGHALVAWGEPVAVNSGQPWPGAIPDPPPTVIYPEPRPAVVLGEQGQAIGVTGRGMVTGEPARFKPHESAEFYPVVAWAGPWPVDELWWDEAAARRVARFQIVGADGRAWLMVVESGRWWTEASYD